MKKVLVTGVAGFVGSHVTDVLLQRGYFVIGIDNFSKGKVENLSNAKKHSSFQLIRGDITNPKIFSNMDRSYNGIFHFAAKKIPRYGGRLETVKENVFGMLNVLEFARKKRKCRVLFASTSDVYGKNPDLPFEETSNSVLGPSTSARWCYAASKLAGEHLCFGYAESYKIPVVIVRIFGTYGPREHLGWWGGPQSAFIENLLDGKKVEIHGDGKQTRCLTYIDDMVNGLVDAIEKSSFQNEILNLGSTEEVSMVKLASIVCRLMKKNPSTSIKYIPYARLSSRDYEDVRRRIPSIKKAKKIIDYLPKVTLSEGLPQTIEWHQSLRGKK